MRYSLNFLLFTLTLTLTSLTEAYQGKTIFRLTHQSDFSQSATGEMQTKQVLPLSFGYQYGPVTFGLEYLQSAAEAEGNPTLLVRSQQQTAALFFDVNFFKDGPFGSSLGAHMGGSHMEVESNLYSNTLSQSSGWYSYTALSASLHYEINPFVALRATGLLQNNVFTTPEWQPAFRAGVQIQL